MADDTAALLKHLNIRSADLFGYSDGGIVAFGVAIRHPERMRKLAVLGANTSRKEDAYDPEFYGQFLCLPADFARPVLKEPYDRAAPDPTWWPLLVAKIKEPGRGFPGYADEETASIQSSALILMGNRDGVRPEHAVEMYRLIPNAQLAIFPGRDHFMLWSSPETVLATVIPFLEAPLPQQRTRRKL